MSSTLPGILAALNFLLPFSLITVANADAFKRAAVDGFAISGDADVAIGVPHGWAEFWDPANPGAAPYKSCRQNGRRIKATECPDT